MSFASFMFGGANYKPNPEDAKLQGSDDLRRQIQQAYGNVQGRTGPQASEPLDFRNQQLGLTQQLQGIASGQRVGAGELAAQRAVTRALAQQQSMASQTRGANSAMAAREAARNAAGLGVAGAGQYQQAALQDQSNAQAQLGQVAAQGRQADQNMSIANMNAALQARGMDDQQRMALLQQLYGISAAELQARMQQGQAQAAGGKNNGMFGQLLQAGGAIGAAYATGGMSSVGQAASSAAAPAPTGAAPALSQEQMQYNPYMPAYR